jgi:hypothetical protein
MVFVYHAFSFSLFKYLIPLFIITTSYIFQKKVKLKFSTKDILIGITASVVILLPFWYFMSLTNKAFIFLPMSTMLFQLFGVSFAEEVYFRGFLQERLGNNILGVLMVSMLFSIMHVPQFIFYGDIYSVMTFFPSLVMGFLYMRTSNVLPSTIFHFFANIVYLGFY